MEHRECRRASGHLSAVGRPAKVLALFLLGVWLGRTVLPRLTASRRALWATGRIGVAIGLPCSFVSDGAPHTAARARVEPVTRPFVACIRPLVGLTTLTVATESTLIAR